MINAQGADVSLWDGGPDDNRQVIAFEEYSETLPFVVIKVSEGLVKDPLFDRQWPAASGRVIRSPYCFFRSFVNQASSVREMLKFLGGDQGEMEAVLDLEAADGSDSVMSLAKSWCTEYQRLTGKWPIIYSTRSFLAENGASARTKAGVLKNPWLANCKLWLAEWPFDELDSLAGYSEKGDALRTILIREVIDGKRQLKWPSPLEPWDHVEIFQWTSRYPPEQIPGYYMGLYHKEVVDMNFHRLTPAELKLAYPMSGVPAPTPIPEPVPTPGGSMQYRVVWANGASERAQPSTAGNSIPPVHAPNSLVDAVQDGIPDVTLPADLTKRWVKLANGHYIASDYGDGTNHSIRMTLVAGTPPPPPTGAVTVDLTLTDNGVVYKGSTTLTKQ